MKSERRHELRENTLVRSLEHLPSTWRTYVGQIVVPLIIVLAVFLLVRYRIDSNRERVERTAQSLAETRALINQLRSGALWQMSEESLAALRSQASVEGENYISQILRDSDDPRT